MSRAPHRVPPAAERARALLVRAGGATVVTGGQHRVVPSVHHVRPAGIATLALPDDDPLVARARTRPDGTPAVLELVDVAPLPLRQPVRGLAWVTGRLRVLPPRVARRAVLRIVDDRPDEHLLDVGHGATLLRLDPATVALSDAEGAAAISPVDLARAADDPLRGTADAWLAHLAVAHPGIVAGLAGLLPARLRRAATVIAPLGADRHGLRLRVEGPRGDHDVRLAFARPLGGPDDLEPAVLRLARAGARPRCRARVSAPASTPSAAAGG